MEAEVQKASRQLFQKKAMSFKDYLAHIMEVGLGERAEEEQKVERKLCELKSTVRKKQEAAARASQKRKCGSRRMCGRMKRMKTT